MRRRFVGMGLLACVLLPTSGAAQAPTDLDEHLRFLQPLMGHLWEGGYVGDDPPDLVISLRFESALSGKSVKYTREVDELSQIAETHFYWSPNRGEVLFLGLNSRGIVREGVASVQDGAIVLQGTDHWPERSIETRTVWQFVEGGVLRDTFTRMENGEWVPGHVQEFVPKDDLEAAGG